VIGGFIDEGEPRMKVIAYLLAIVCVIVAVMYSVMPGGSLPTFMREIDAHSHDARRRRRHSSRYLFVDRPLDPAMMFLTITAHLALY
jgi:hypothetical protein